MKKIKRFVLLTLCCLILCQTTVDNFPANDGVETCGNYDTNKKD